MSVTAVLHPDLQRFPVGTTVKAYKRSNFAGTWNRSGAPEGSQDASATVAADGSVTFTGLTAETEYVLYASVSSADIYASFSTKTESVGGTTYSGTQDFSTAVVTFADDSIPQSKISSLVTALAAKAASVHTHVMASITDLAIDTAQLVNSAVTSGKLAANAVTAGKLADGAVDTAARLADGIVSTVKLAAGAVTADKLAETARFGWKPDNSIAEVFPRLFAQNAITLTSGTLELIGGIVIPKGKTVSSASFSTGNTAAGTPTHQFAVLLDQARNVLAVSADLTTAAWNSDTLKTFTFTTPYVATADTPVYVGIVVVASVMPNLLATPVGVRGGVQNISTKMALKGSAGLTDPASLGASSSAGAVTGQWIYCYVS